MNRMNPNPKHPMPAGVTRVPGVSWNTKNGRWVAQITSDGVQRYLGSFRDHADAAKARKDAELRTRGRGQRGRGARRFDAPPGMRACARIECIYGPNGTRYIGPEEDFLVGATKRSYCRKCRADVARLAFYRNGKNEKVKEYNKRKWKVKKREHRRQVDTEIKMGQAAIERLRLDGWSFAAIGRAIDIDVDTVRAWYYGWSCWRRATDVHDRLIELGMHHAILGKPRPAPRVTRVPQSYQRGANKKRKGTGHGNAQRRAS